MGRRRSRRCCPCPCACPWPHSLKMPFSSALALLLFLLALLSLLVGNLASHLHWSHFRRRIRIPIRTPLPLPALDLWRSNHSLLYHSCSHAAPSFPHAVPENGSNGYLLIATSGGLNQQRIGISDAVVVARIMNATLVIPEMDRHSFWKDDSDFANIFDVDWFISYLSRDVPIVKRIPDRVMRSMEKLPWTMRPPRKSLPEYYLQQVLPILRRRHVRNWCKR